VAYRTTGNITKKSDASNTAGCMTYSGTAGPFALTAISGTVNGVVNPTFLYDANGNVPCELGSGKPAPMLRTTSRRSSPDATAATQRAALEAHD
jgi:hypothetical protein